MTAQAFQFITGTVVFVCGTGLSWLTRSSGICECARSENDPILKLLQAQLERCGPEKLNSVTCPAAVVSGWTDFLHWSLTLLLSSFGFVVGRAGECHCSSEPEPQQLLLTNVPRWRPTGTNRPGRR